VVLVYLLLSKKVFLSYSVDADFNYKGCNLLKPTQLPYSSSTGDSSYPFDLVHSDVWSPSPFVSQGGHKHYIIFVDDQSRYT
jgi:hypothetical protein